MVKCNSQVHHAVPRRICYLACYVPSTLSMVVQVVCYCSQTLHSGVFSLTVGGVTFIVKGFLGWLLPFGSSFLVVVGANPSPNYTVPQLNSYWNYGYPFMYFSLWFPGGTNWYLTSVFVVLYFIVVEASSSMTCYQGLKPRAFSSAAKSLKISIIYLSLLFFIGEVIISFQ